MFGYGFINKDVLGVDQVVFIDVEWMVKGKQDLELYNVVFNLENYDLVVMWD